MHGCRFLGGLQWATPFGALHQDFPAIFGILADQFSEVGFWQEGLMISRSCRYHSSRGQRCDARHWNFLQIHDQVVQLSLSADLKNISRKLQRT
jgi:hypothetical protein